MSEHFLERQHIELRKEMSTQQIKWEKEKALMQQKIEQLETRLVESQDREQRLKKSHQFLLESLSKMNQNEEGKKTMFLLENLTDQVKQMRDENREAAISEVITAIDRHNERKDNHSQGTKNDRNSDFFENSLRPNQNGEGDRRSLMVERFNFTGDKQLESRTIERDSLQSSPHCIRYEKNSYIREKHVPSPSFSQNVKSIDIESRYIPNRDIYQEKLDLEAKYRDLRVAKGSKPSGIQKRTEKIAILNHYEDNHIVSGDYIQEFDQEYPETNHSISHQKTPTSSSKQGEICPSLMEDFNPKYKTADCGGIGQFDGKQPGILSQRGDQFGSVNKQVAQLSKTASRCQSNRDEFQKRVGEKLVESLHSEELINRFEATDQIGYPLTTDSKTNHRKRKKVSKASSICRSENPVKIKAININMAKHRIKMELSNGAVNTRTLHSKLGTTSTTSGRRSKSKTLSSFPNQFQRQQTFNGIQQSESKLSRSKKDSLCSKSNTNISRKEVIEILKLHRNLQDKIKYLENKFSHPI